jgi:tRNA1Val (adenine37-N6)-methyltransferase
VSQDEPEWTRDTILMGRGALVQRRRGYRFGIDSVLLGVGAARLGAARVLDAGCGMGVVGIALLLALPEGARPEVHGVEAQEGLLALARENAALNALEGRYQAHHGDLRALEALGLGRFDLILLNPPYYGAREGTINPDPERAEARHELRGDLEALLGGCRAALARRGRLRLIYPARKLPLALQAARRHDLWPARLRFLHSRARSNAYAVLMDLKAKAGEVEISPPLILYQGDERYTDEVQALLEGNGEGL